ncbi:hypothetical protein [Devosia sp.]|uniref:hypothetical protein n=1 Tax=Devosia sp. TaxID=1871048 RepID=UPI0027327026|nr:hypothetical protein [Devosia sp.]MDP2780303.1 hypothetical protein [Devosia sp.]
MRRADAVLRTVRAATRLNARHLRLIHTQAIAARKLQMLRLQNARCRSAVLQQRGVSRGGASRHVAGPGRRRCRAIRACTGRGILVCLPLLFQRFLHADRVQHQVELFKDLGRMAGDVRAIAFGLCGR